MAENKKYELTNESVEIEGVTVYRIKALKDFADVKKGDLGGFVEKENNLSHEGNCWVHGNAVVCDNAKVSHDALVFGNATVYGNAKIFSNATVFGNAKVYGNATVFGNAKIFGDATLCDNTLIRGNAWVSGNAMVSGDVRVSGDTKIFDTAEILDTAEIKSAYVVTDDACIGSENGYLTAYTNKDGDTLVNRDCFSGTLEEFEKAVELKHGDNKYGREYNCLIEAIKIKLGGK